MLLLAGAACAAGILPGCAQRTITVESNPPGALVWLNDQEIGRTPVTRNFTWYGDYQVELRKEGYDTIKTHQGVIAPWWQWVPFDLFAEFFPVTDRQKYSYTMKREAPPSSVNAGAMERRGESLKDDLRTGVNYHEKPPTTRKTKASTRTATQPTTSPGAEPTGF